MNGAVANVLNSVLGSWVDNINSEQLKLSIFSGEVKLKDLKLKDSAIESLGFPFKLLSGTISMLTVNIPWTKLGSSPLQIRVEEVYALISPSSPSTWNEQRESEKVKIFKKTLLENYEALSTSELSISEDKGFVEKLVKKIILNVQVRVKKVFLLYQDNITSSCGFSAGVFIRSLKAVTTNSEWKAEFIESADINYKLASLKEFRIFLDNEVKEFRNFEDLVKGELSGEVEHCYILRPTTFVLKAKLNTNPSVLTEHLYSFSLSNSKIYTGIDTFQLRHIMKILEFINAFDLFCTGIKQTLVEPELSTEYIDKYREAYKIYRIQNKNPGKKKEFKELTEIEEKFNVYSLIQHRKFVDKQLELLRKEENIKEEIKKTEAESNEGMFGKFSSMIWGKSASQKQEELERRKSKIDSMNLKLAEILIEQNKLAEEMNNLVSGSKEFSKVPKEFVLYFIHLVVKRIRFTLKDNEQDLAVFKMRGLQVETGIREASMYVKGIIKNTGIEESVSQSQSFPYFMKGEELQIEYDNMDRAVFNMKSGGFAMVCNFDCIFKVSEAFGAVFAESDSKIKAKYMEQMTESTSKYLESGENYLKELMRTGIDSTLQLFIDVKAPIFYIPIDIQSSASGFLVADLGHLYANTKLIKENEYKFNMYTFEFTNTRISAIQNCENFTDWLSHNPIDILEKTDCFTIIKLCTEVQYSISGIQIDLKFSPIKLHIRDDILSFVLDLYSVILKKLPESQPSAPVKQIENTESYKDQMKRIKKIIGIELKLTIDTVSFRIIEQLTDLAIFYVNDFHLSTKLMNDGSLGTDFSLLRMDLVDLREGIKLKTLVCNPLVGMNESKLGEEEEVVPQIRFNMFLKAKDDMLDMALYLNDMRFILDASIFIRLSEYFKNASVKLPDTKKVVDNKIASTYMTTFNTRVILQLNNFELWLPLTTTETTKRTGCFSLGAFAEYKSLQSYKSFFNTLGQEISREYLIIQDQATLTLTNLGGYIGLINKNRVVLSEERTHDLMPPSRIGVGYSCYKQSQGAPESNIELNLESIQFEVGFRDIQFFQSLSEKWKNLQFSSPSAPETEKKPGKMTVKVDSDAVKLTLLEDTGVKAYSLLHFHLSSFKICTEISELVTQGSFSTFLYSDYYNLKVCAWEPLIENWNLYAEAEQKNADSPLIVHINSTNMLNMNITMAMLEIMGTCSRKLSENSGFWAEDSYREKAMTDQNELLAHGQFFYSIENSLGIPISVWLDLPKTEVDTWVLPPNQSQMFSYHQLKDKINLSSSKKGLNNGITEDVQAPVGLCLSIEGYNQVKNLFFERVGIKGFILSSPDRKINCILNIFAKDNLRVIRIETAISCMNNTMNPLILMCGKNEQELEPGTSWPLPLKWVTRNEKPVVLAKGSPVPLQENKIFEMVTGDWAIQTVNKYKTLNKIPQTFIIFNPPLSFENMLPGLLSIFLNKSEQPVAVINSGSVFSYSRVNPSSIQEIMIKAEFLGENEENWKIKSEWANYKSDQIQFSITGDVAGRALFADCSKLEILKCKNIDLTGRKSISDQEFLTSQKLEFYSPYIIVNKTDLTLDIIEGKYGIPSKPYSISFLKKPKLKMKITKEKFGESSDFSKDFNIDAIGISGSLSLPFKKQNDLTPKEYTLGISVISASVPLIKSKIVKIAPRYIICNMLEYSVFVRQYFKDSEGGITMLIEKDTKNSFNLENSEISRLIQVSRDGKNWSTPFSIQNIEDFQIKFRANPGESGENWHEPNEFNNFCHYSRVFITTEDQATLHTFLTVPKEPEFCINNLTNDVFMVRQGKFEGLKIPYQRKVPWAFDDLTKEKVLDVSIDGKSKEINIEKVKKSKKFNRFRLEVRVIGVVRELTITLARGSVDSDISVIEPKTILKLNMHLRGFGLSIIDGKPSELLYISAIEIESKIRQKESRDKKRLIRKSKLYLAVGKFQIDNMQAKGKLYPMIFGPSSKNDETVPMFQLEVDKSSYRHLINKKFEKDSIDRYSWVEVSLQELRLNIDQEVIETILTFSTNAISALNFIQPFKPYSSKLVPIKTICPYLDTKDNFIEGLDGNNNIRSYFKLLRFCAIKILISFRKNPKGRDLSLDPKNGFGLLQLAGAIGKAFINISDSPIYFKEVFIQESFQSISVLVSRLIKNYQRQGVLQFYKILGSSDLIGNPVGLIDKLGTGVLEFISEPVKGVIKGPKAFAEGITKGIRSLVGNIVAGSFGSISKITGNLYGLVREVGGDTNGADRINDSDNAFENFFHGIKGGVIDIAEGFTGIFTKPWKGAKKGGAKGLLKGIGSGLLGAVTSPLSAALRIGSGISTGVTNAATFLAKGKVTQLGRVRFPRHFSPLEVLEPYNWEVAEAQGFLNGIQELRKELIVFYMRIEEEESLIIIVTLNFFLFIVNTDLKQKFELMKINSLEIHKPNDNNFYLRLETELDESLVISSENYSPLIKLYAAVTSMIEPPKVTKQLRKIVAPNRYGTTCCRIKKQNKSVSRYSLTIKESK